MLPRRLLRRRSAMGRYRDLCCGECRRLCCRMGGLHEARVARVEGDLVSLRYAKVDHAHTNSETEQAHADVMTEQREQPVISIDDVAVYFTKGCNKERCRVLLRYHGKRIRDYIFWPLLHVSFDLHPGESIGVVGRNDQGKFTLFKVVAGILIPDEGQVRVNASV